jgi:hypothetical protein
MSAALALFASALTVALGIAIALATPWRIRRRNLRRLPAPPGFVRVELPDGRVSTRRKVC